MDLDFALYPYFHTCLQPVASSNIKFTFKYKALWENLLFLEKQPTWTLCTTRFLYQFLKISQMEMHSTCFNV